MSSVQAGTSRPRAVVNFRTPDGGGQHVPTDVLCAFRLRTTADVVASSACGNAPDGEVDLCFVWSYEFVHPPPAGGHPMLPGIGYVRLSKVYQLALPTELLRPCKLIPNFTMYSKRDFRAERDERTTFDDKQVRFPHFFWMDENYL